MSIRWHRVVPYIALVAIFALLVLPPSGAGAAKTSPKEWAGGVCSAVQEFARSVDSTLSDLKQADSVQAAADDVSTGLRNAADQLRKSLDDLGKPSTSDGGKARSAVQKLGNHLSDSADTIRGLLSPPPQTVTEIASTFAAIGSEIRQAVDAAKSTASTLRGLKPNGQLQKAFQSAPSCTELKQSLSA